MATFTDLINEVLIELREAQISAWDETEYSTLIGNFVNKAKREVEDAWNWNALRTQIQVTTADSTNGYSLTGAGQRWRFIDPKFPAFDETNLSHLKKGNSTWIKSQLLSDTNTGFPAWFYIQGIDGSNDPVVYFYSLPGGVYTINFEVVVPQDDLAASGTVLTVPKDPVILGAYAFALAEKGEDNGNTISMAERKYQLALSDAIALDASNSDDEEWTVD